MAIPVRCAECGAEFRAKDEHAGRRGKCPKCQAVIQVPGPSVKPQPAPVTKSPPPAQAGAAAKSGAQEILGAFQGEIEPARVPAGYKLGILLVSVVMVVTRLRVI